jgi:hypothetical protein
MLWGNINSDARAARAKEETEFMPDNLSKRPSEIDQAPAEPARKSIVTIVTVVGLLAVLAAVALRKRGPHNDTGQPTNLVATAAQGKPKPIKPGTPAAPPGTISSATDHAPLPPVTPPSRTGAGQALSNATTTSSGPAASAYTRQIMSNLSGLDVSKGISAEQAEQWKGELQKLVKEGAGGVPAIREFLEKNVDLSFEGAEGGSQMGTPSLRMALFDTLAQIGGPEAIGLATRTLQTTADPREIAVLARNLDQMAPEQHREAAVAAAREAMALAAKDTRATDISPLFEVLQKYGGSAAATELEQAASKWNYYGPLALASLTNGAGVPSLARMAQDPQGQYRSSSRFAMQMLAQLAPQSPEASQALIEQVKAQKVPDAAWYGIASALAGTQVFFGNTYLDSTPVPANTRDPKSYSIPVNQQHYRSFDVSANWTPEQIQKQVQLIDQLRSANPFAAAALEPTRAALAARLSQ